MLAPVAASAEPTAAATTRYYVAVGDSLAAGFMVGPGHGYVDDVFNLEKTKIPQLELKNFACPGETTTSMINGGGFCGYHSGSQLGDAEAFIAGHPGQIAFVTIDIGANDVLSCFFSVPIPTGCVAAGMPSVEANLATILDGLRGAGGTEPIVGLTYYDPFVQYWLMGGDGPAAAHESVKQIKVLNVGLTRVLRKHKDLVASGAHAFDISNFGLRGTWNGNRVPVNVQNACNWTFFCTEFDVHPNNTGYGMLAAAVEGVIDQALARHH